jgi:5'/3'-nucleotidase SurE
VSRYAQIRAKSNFSVDEERRRVATGGEPRAPGERGVALWSLVDASPASTVNIALNNLVPFPVDLVLSGPNLGRNAGRGFSLSSGTIGAALEAAINGTRSIAISFAFTPDMWGRFDARFVADACEATLDVVQRLWAAWPAEAEFFNINLPLGCGRHPRVFTCHMLHDSYGALFHPVSVVQQRVQQLRAAAAESRTAFSRPKTSVLMAPSQGKELQADEQFFEETAFEFEFDFGIARFRSLPNFYGSDMWAIEQGVVSVTPARCHLQEVAGAGSNALVFPAAPPPAPAPAPASAPAPELKD